MGVEATEVLEHLVHNTTGRLVAQKASSRSIGDTRVRLRRSIQVKRGGKWIDPAAELLRRGLVLWFPNGQEWAWNGTYARLAEEAAAKGVGIWNPEACGKPGPSATSPLSIKPKWDGENKDRASGEWIRITNHDPVNAVPLGGWAVRDSHLRGDKHQPGYKFPSERGDPAERLDRGQRRPRHGRRTAPSTGASRRRRRSSRTRPTTRSRWATAPTSSTRTASCARTRSTRAA